MPVFSEDKPGLPSPPRDWTFERTRGFIQGAQHRRLGTLPSSYPIIGMDDYCVGFREGYFERHPSSPNPRDPQRVANRLGAPATRPQRDPVVSENTKIKKQFAGAVRYLMRLDGPVNRSSNSGHLVNSERMSEIAPCWQPAL